MAEAIGISVRDCAKIEQGEKVCDERMIENIAAFFKVTPSELCSGNVTENLNFHSKPKKIEYFGDKKIAENVLRRFSELSEEEQIFILLMRRIKNKSALKQMLFDMIQSQEQDFNDNN